MSKEALLVRRCPARSDARAPDDGRKTSTGSTQTASTEATRRRSSRARRTRPEHKALAPGVERRRDRPPRDAPPRHRGREHSRRSGHPAGRSCTRGARWCAAATPGRPAPGTRARPRWRGAWCRPAVDTEPELADGLAPAGERFSRAPEAEYGHLAAAAERLPGAQSRPCWQSGRPAAPRSSRGHGGLRYTARRLAAPPEGSGEEVPGSADEEGVDAECWSSSA